MSADTNIFLKLLEKESQSTPVSSEILDVLSEDEGVFKRYEDVVFERLMDGMKDDSVDSFSHYYETIENLMNVLQRQHALIHPVQMNDVGFLKLL